MKISSRAGWKSGNYGHNGGSAGWLRGVHYKEANKNGRYACPANSSIPRDTVRIPAPHGRAISSAGEHCLHTAGVTGSIPVSPTNPLNRLETTTTRYKLLDHYVDEVTPLKNGTEPETDRLFEACPKVPNSRLLPVVPIAPETMKR